MLSHWLEFSKGICLEKLQRNILEKSITEAVLIKINPKHDFSPAPSILGSHLLFPLMTRECIMQVTSKHIQITQDRFLNV